MEVVTETSQLAMMKPRQFFWPCICPGLAAATLMVITRAPAANWGIHCRQQGHLKQSLLPKHHVLSHEEHHCCEVQQSTGQLEKNEKLGGET